MTPTILVIEDESDIQAYLMAVLEDQGFDARAVSDRDGIDDQVRELDPVLILLDVMMPMRSGVSIYKALRTSPGTRRIPVVILSGFSSHGSRMSGEFRDLMSDASIAPPDGFIDKPIDLDRLIRLVHDLTSKKR